MKIAILGTRGVPPSYGGFETFAAEVSTRLVQRGHDVSVYCREVDESSSRQVDKASLDDSTTRRLDDPATRRLDDSTTRRLDDPTTRRLDDPATRRLDDWHGVHRIVLPAARHKYFETVSHTFLSALHAIRQDFDAVLVCNAANAFVLPLLRAARIPVAINVDGIERKRRKWNVFGRAVYAIGEAFSAGFASTVIADAGVIADYYRANYALEPAVIPYGSEFPAEEDSDVLQRLGLRPRSYILYVSRFEPENNPLEVVEGYQLAVGSWRNQLAVGSWQLTGAGAAEAPADCRLPTANPPLVMVGKGLYAKDLVARLHARKSPSVLLPGALYGADYRTLQRNALIYIQATEVGGTHPAMIEAMASGGAVLAHDTPENREVGGDAVGYFALRPEQTLSGMLSEWLSKPLLREDFRARARKRAAERYSWERVTGAYEELFRNFL